MAADQLSRTQALALVGLSDGLLRCGSLPLLSLPFVLEVDRSLDREVLVSHFERSRTDFHDILARGESVSVSFVVGFHYVDPTWIPRQPHAPTEIKAVFEFRGPARIIRRAANETLQMLQNVTRAKQELYIPSSTWSVAKLPESYTSKLLPHIVEFSVEPESYSLSRLMVLQHLSVEDRRGVLMQLDDLHTPSSKAAAWLLRMFL